MVRRLLRDPLIHFLIAGSLLFVVFDLIPQRGIEDSSIIVVGDAELLPFIMSRNPRLGPQAASEYLVSIGREQRDRFIQEYIREEVLYRQALALGLDENNYTERRRLIAQLEYINEGFIDESLEIGELEILAHYQQNRSRYSVPPQVTFTHVYFSADRHGDAARDLAAAELSHLNDVNLAFHLAASRGDHFLYHSNYVNKNFEEVASHFGSPFATAVFAIDGAQTRWLGPYQSAYGFHLILLTSKKEEYIPPLDEIRARLIDDVTRIRVREELDRFYEEVRSTYEIRIADPGTGP